MGELVTLGCPECPYKGKKVGPKGPADAKIVFVGESPGLNELQKGIPFVGSSGEVLDSVTPDKLLDNILYLNALSCYPNNKEDQGKFVGATKSCNKRLLTQIEEHPRDIIVALGNAALWSLTDNYELRITKDRGKIFPSKYSKYGIIPAIHPAALMRGVSTYAKFKSDIKYAIHLAQGGDPKTFAVPKLIVCNTDAQIKKQVARLIKKKDLVGDVETGGINGVTGGLDRWEDKILELGVTVTGMPKTSVIFPIRNYTKKQITLLKPLFRKKRAPGWCWHNGKFDIAFLRRYGLEAYVDNDTMLMSYALDETSGGHDLETVASDEIGAPDYKHVLKPFLPNKNSSYELIPQDILQEYLAKDTSNTAQIQVTLGAKIEADPLLKKLYHKTLIPASELLYHVERYGMLVDLKQLDKNDKRFVGSDGKGGIINEHKIKLCELAGKDVNPNSPKQMSELLYDQLKIPTRRGRGTGKDILEKLPPHPAVKALLAHRKAAKSYGTYVKGIRSKIAADGRVHSTYLIHGTRTGRLSSREPNMQNIPRDPMLRGQFIAPPGKMFLKVDLNQAELRSLACLSGCEAMMEIYHTEGMSLHDELSIFLFGEGFDSEQKMRAKAVNFGIVYGREAPSLAEEFDESIAECQDWIDGWFERFPGAYEFIKKCRKAPMRGKNLVTCFGRKKRFGLVNRSNLREMQNQAANFLHQSIASDITLHAGIETRPKLVKRNVNIVNLVHDELLMELPKDKELCNWAIAVVKESMERIPIEWGLTRVPFLAEADTGTRWGHLKKVA